VQKAHLIGKPLGGSPLDTILNAIPARSPLWHAVSGTFTSGDMRRWVQYADKESRHMATIKPERQLGAPWIDDFVSRGRGVVLCEDCYRKYDKWWVKYDYAPQWHPKLISDCDGCSTTMIICTGFFPRNNAH